MNTLYEKLRAAHQISRVVRYDLDVAKNQLEQVLDTHRDGFPDMLDLQNFDLEKIERVVFEQYRTNPHLARAIDGAESLKEAALRLGAQKDFYHLIPHRKNDAINQEVAELEELLPHADALGRRGSLNFSNGLNAGALIGIPASLVLFGICAFEDRNYIEATKVAGVLGGFIWAVAGFGTYIAMSDYAISTTKHAEYIDKKIKELF